MKGGQIRARVTTKKSDSKKSRANEFDYLSLFFAKAPNPPPSPLGQQQKRSINVARKPKFHNTNFPSHGCGGSQFSTTE